MDGSRLEHKYEKQAVLMPSWQLCRTHASEGGDHEFKINRLYGRFQGHGCGWGEFFRIG